MIQNINVNFGDISNIFPVCENIGAITPISRFRSGIFLVKVGRKLRKMLVCRNVKRLIFDLILLIPNEFISFRFAEKSF